MSVACYSWDFAKNKPSLVDSRYDLPCPSGGGCCAPGDACMGTFMYKHKVHDPNPNRPDYYVGACTDPKYASSSCLKFCSKYVRTGVVYNSTTDRWACCGTADPQSNLTTLCATPTDDTFALVQPENLPIIGIAGTGSAVSTSSAYTSSITTSGSVSSTVSQAVASSTSISDSSSHGPGLSSQIGLSVGLGTGIALVIAVAIFVFIRWRRISNTRAASHHFGMRMTSDPWPVGPKQEIYLFEQTYSPLLKSIVPCRNGSSDNQICEMGDSGILRSELPPGRSNGREELP